MRILSVISGKGGVGKTTLVANLGLALSKMGKRVILIDCNLTTSHLGMHFGIPAERTTLNDVLRGDLRVEEALHTHSSNLKILPASISHRNMRGVDVLYLGPVVRRLDADFVLLDAPPGFERNTHGVLMATHEALIVTTPDLPSVIDVVRCTETLDDQKIHTTGLVVNMRGRGKDELTSDEIEGVTGLDIIEEVPFDRNMQSSMRKRIPILDQNPGSGASRAFMKLAHDLTGREYEPPLFSRIRNAISIDRIRAMIGV